MQKKRWYIAQIVDISYSFNLLVFFASPKKLRSREGGPEGEGGGVPEGGSRFCLLVYLMNKLMSLRVNLIYNMSEDQQSKLTQGYYFPQPPTQSNK